MAKMSGIGCSSIQRPAAPTSTSLRDVAGREARHLGGDHAAHRVADEVRLLQAERVDDVPAVQGEVEHVLEQLLAGRLAVARPARGRRRDSARASWSRNGLSAKSPPAPWRKTSGAPLPPSSTRQRAPRFVSIVRVFIGATPPSSPRRSALLRTQAVVHGLDPPALVVLPLRPEVAQVRHDLLGEELGGVARLPVRHVAVVEQAEEMADAQALDALLELLAHRLRTAGDDEALVDELLPGQVLEDLLRLEPELRQRAGLDRLDGAVAGRIGERREHVQAAVEEVEAVLGVELLGLAVGVGDADDLRERGAIRRDRPCRAWPRAPSSRPCSDLPRR